MNLTRTRFAFIVVGLSLIEAVCAACSSSAAPPPPTYRDTWVKVQLVMDATTVLLEDGRTIHQLGLIAPVSPCQAQLATQQTRARLQDAYVSLTREPGVWSDGVGGRWAYLFSGPNIGGRQTNDVGVELAKSGWVVPYPQSPDSPNYEAIMRAANDFARNAGLGIYGLACMPPAIANPQPTVVNDSVPSTPDSTPVNTDPHVHVDVDHHHHKRKWCHHWWC